MTTRFATAAVALALSLGAPAAFGQAGNWPHPARAPVSAYDDITTGSIGIARPQVRDGWGAVSSAKAGNANQQNFPVQQYGQTAGGPAYWARARIEDEAGLEPRLFSCPAPKS